MSSDEKLMLLYRADGAAGAFNILWRYLNYRKRSLPPRLRSTTRGWRGTLADLPGAQREPFFVLQQEAMIVLSVSLVATRRLRLNFSGRQSGIQVTGG